MTVEDSLKLLERYGVTLVVLAVVAFAIGICATILYREWLHWRPRVERWIDDWRTSAEKTQESQRTAVSLSMDMQRSNSLTLQGCALNLKAIEESMQKLADASCPLSDSAYSTEIRSLRDQLRTQRKLSESRPTPPSQIDSGASA